MGKVNQSFQVFVQNYIEVQYEYCLELTVSSILIFSFDYNFLLLRNCLRGISPLFMIENFFENIEKKPAEDIKLRIFVYKWHYNNTPKAAQYALI